MGSHLFMLMENDTHRAIRGPIVVVVMSCHMSPSKKVSGSIAICPRARVSRLSRHSLSTSLFNDKTTLPIFADKAVFRQKTTQTHALWQKFATLGKQQMRIEYF